MMCVARSCWLAVASYCVVYQSSVDTRTHTFLFIGETHTLLFIAETHTLLFIGETHTLLFIDLSLHRGNQFCLCTKELSLHMLAYQGYITSQLKAR